jgi:hypothetical protein
MSTFLVSLLCNRKGQEKVPEALRKRLSSAELELDYQMIIFNF